MIGGRTENTRNLSLFGLLIYFEEMLNQIPCTFDRGGRIEDEKRRLDEGRWRKEDEKFEIRRGGFSIEDGNSSFDNFITSHQQLIFLIML